jgi:hypothetical protein
MIESSYYYILHNLIMVWLVCIFIIQLHVSTDMASSSGCTLYEMVVDVADVYSCFLETDVSIFT